MLLLARHLRDSGRSCDRMSILSQDGPVRDQYAAHGIRHVMTADFADYGVVIRNTIFAAAIVSPAAKFAKTVWWIHEGGNGLDHILRVPLNWPPFQDATAIVSPPDFHPDAPHRPFLGAL